MSALIQVRLFFKVFIISLFSVFIFGCDMEETSYLCVNCASVALRVRLFDANEKGIEDTLAVIVINAKGDTLNNLNSESQIDLKDNNIEYYFYGLPGRYQIYISGDNFNSAKLENVSVKQHPGMTCEHAETKHIYIKLKSNPLKKRSNKTEEDAVILEEFSEGSC